jgi:hypothetical protein
MQLSAMSWLWLLRMLLMRIIRMLIADAAAVVAHPPSSLCSRSLLPHHANPTATAFAQALGEGEAPGELDTDIHDRALMFYRLLQEDVAKAKDIILCEKAKIGSFVSGAKGLGDKVGTVLCLCLALSWLLCRQVGGGGAGAWGAGHA